MGFDVDGWREGQIGDTAENARYAIEALASQVPLFHVPKHERLKGARRIEPIQVVGRFRPQRNAAISKPQPQRSARAARLEGSR